MFFYKTETAPFATQDSKSTKQNLTLTINCSDKENMDDIGHLHPDNEGIESTYAYGPFNALTAACRKNSKDQRLVYCARVVCLMANSNEISLECQIKLGWREAPSGHETQEN